MAKYVVVHPLEGVLEEKEGEKAARAIKANCSADAYWIRSTLIQDDGKLVCDWEAKDPEAIRAVLDAAAKTTPILPVEGIYPVTAVVYGEDFR